MRNSTQSSSKKRKKNCVPEGNKFSAIVYLRGIYFAKKLLIILETKNSVKGILSNKKDFMATNFLKSFLALFSAITLIV